MSALVQVMFETPPIRGRDGGWYRTFKLVELPEHIAQLFVDEPPLVQLVSSAGEVRAGTPSVPALVEPARPQAGALPGNQPEEGT